MITDSPLGFITTTAAASQLSGVTSLPTAATAGDKKATAISGLSKQNLDVGSPSPAQTLRNIFSPTLMIPLFFPLRLIPPLRRLQQPAFSSTSFKKLPAYLLSPQSRYTLKPLKPPTFPTSPRALIPSFPLCPTDTEATPVHFGLNCDPCSQKQLIKASQLRCKSELSD